MLEYARGAIRRGVDCVVMGHRHKPALVPLEGGVYVNLGDWITFGTYGLFAGGTMTLNTWNGTREADHR